METWNEMLKIFISSWNIFVISLNYTYFITLKGYFSYEVYSYFTVLFLGLKSFFFFFLLFYVKLSDLMNCSVAEWQGQAMY